MARPFLWKAGWALVCAFALAPLVAAEATALDRFLEGLVGWRAEFTQSITDSRGRSRAPQRGLLIVQRPGKFRWEIGPPEQVMVADGRNVWFHDRDLEQVTVRAASSALSATPAMLLAGAGDLRSAFSIEASGRRAGLEWVRARPLRSDGEFREARFGFAGLDLRRLEIDDKLGQQAVLVFGQSARNPPLESAALRFTPPAGADLIGKPVE